MAKQLDRKQLKIVFIHAEGQDDDDEPLGCIVIHQGTNLAAVSEDASQPAFANFEKALAELAAKMGLPADVAVQLNCCPTCGQRTLPEIPGWRQNHSFCYEKELVIHDGETTTVHGQLAVYREFDESHWCWADSNDRVDGGEEIFLEDAIEAAEKAYQEILAAEEMESGAINDASSE